jgi:hypothetical protein
LRNHDIAVGFYNDALPPPAKLPHTMDVAMMTLLVSLAVRGHDLRKKFWRHTDLDRNAAKYRHRRKARRCSLGTDTLARYATHQHWLAQCQTRQQSAGLRLLAVKDITPLEGGLPVILDGTIIGAIGVCGTLYSQDAQVARARVK